MRLHAIILAGWMAALPAWSAGAEGEATSRPSRVTPVVRAYRKAAPAVVNISTQQVARVGPRMFGRGDDPFEEFLFEMFGRRVPTVSLGSGFLVHPDGYIITNAHVVRRADKISVTLADKSTYEAEAVAINDQHDLALLRIADAKARKFKFLRLGRSDDLMIGETVIAIGNPLGYQNTCTTGVLSAVNRTLNFRGGATYSGIIQIDAPINPGSSGGPLLNIAGELIGVNTAIRPDAQGIGFAIPVDSLTADLARLVDFERVNRVIFGLEVTQIRGKDGDEVVISAVAPGSPAAQAGCKKGDRLLAIGGKEIDQLPAYLVAMLATKAGDEVKLRCDRAGGPTDLTVKLGARPKPDGAALVKRHFGLTLETLTAAKAAELQLAVQAGMLVTVVAPGSPAARLGLRRGDVIFQLGRWYVKDLDRVGAVLEDVGPGDKLQLGIVRGATRAWTIMQARRIDMTPPTTRKARI